MIGNVVAEGRMESFGGETGMLSFRGRRFELFRLLLQQFRRVDSL